LKRLIINADDFGFTKDVNAGIIQAHREGILTSTTLMANGNGFEDAVRLARETPTLDVGCHLVLVQGRSLVTGREFPEKLGNAWAALISGRLNVYDELRAQIEKILGAGIRPTHLDSHKHTHVVPHVFRQVVRLANEFEIPYVRLPLDHTAAITRIPSALAGRYYRRFAHGTNVQMTDYFLGFRLTGSLTEKTFAAALASVREGTTELMCHPGCLGPELMRAATRLKESRVRELEALTSSEIRKLVERERIELTDFGALAG
jgi:chitin disaccharide deacetylase